MKYEVIRADRAARPVEVGTIVHKGRDFYGLAGDDTMLTGIVHIVVSESESGQPFFTIPAEDVSPVPEELSND